MAAPVTYTGTTPGAGYSAPDYHGSFEEWVEMTARGMLSRYVAGDQSMLDSMTMSTSGLGQPDRNDFGSGRAAGNSNGQGAYSFGTQAFFEAYVRRAAENYTRGQIDPFMFGGNGQGGATTPPPSRHATFGIDPNSPSAQNQQNNDAQAAMQAAQDKATGERQAAHDTAAANMQAASDTAAYQRVKYQVDSAWNTAVMEDATRKYVAEGDWGVQKYVADQNNKGSMDRLILQLGAADKDRAQQAIAEQNRHHESMIGLTLEVAKYDAELSKQPHNWIAYATWLNNRGLVINGLNLAMAADAVPAQSLSPAEIAQSSPIAAYQAGTSQGQIPTSSFASPTQNPTFSPDGQSPPGTVNTTQPEQTGFGVTANQTASQGTGMAVGGVAATPINQGGPDTTGQGAPEQTGFGATANAAGSQNLNSTDYAALARNLMGITPDTQAPSTGALQAAYNGLNTQGRGGGIGALNQGSGMATNSLGMTVNTVGAKENAVGFNNLTPDAQDMKLAAANSGGVSDRDFLYSLQRGRPKGGASGGVAVA